MLHREPDQPARQAEQSASVQYPASGPSLHTQSPASLHVPCPLQTPPSIVVGHAMLQLAPTKPMEHPHAAPGAAAHVQVPCPAQMTASGPPRGHAAAQSGPIQPSAHCAQSNPPHPRLQAHVPAAAASSAEHRPCPAQGTLGRPGFVGQKYWHAGPTRGSTHTHASSSAEQEPWPLQTAPVAPKGQCSRQALP